MSIIVIGVGNEDFTQMRKLNDNFESFHAIQITKPVRETSIRKNVQFVQANEFHDNMDQLGRNVLHSIPNQIKQFYCLKENNY